VRGLLDRQGARGSPSLPLCVPVPILTGNPYPRWWCRLPVCPPERKDRLIACSRCRGTAGAGVRSEQARVKGGQVGRMLVTAREFLVNPAGIAALEVGARLLDCRPDGRWCYRRRAGRRPPRLCPVRRAAALAGAARPGPGDGAALPVGRRGAGELARRPDQPARLPAQVRRVARARGPAAGCQGGRHAPSYRPAKRPGASSP